jgi:hypothetical protein
MAAARGRRAGSLHHGLGDVHRGRTGEELRPPHPAVGLRFTRRDRHPAGRLIDDETGGGHRCVGPTHTGPDVGEMGDPPRLAVGDTFVHTGLCHANIDGGITRHHPMRHHLSHEQRETFDPTEQRLGRHHHVEVQVV